MENDKEEKEEYLLSDLNKSSHEEELVEEAVKRYVCPKCGSSFYSNSLDDCVYCGEKCDVSDGKFDMINVFHMPFEKTIEDAVKEYKKYIRFKFFAPFSLRSKKLLNGMKKVYIPALIKNCNINGCILFYAADNNKSNSLVKYEVGHKVNIDFDNLFLSLYSKVDQEMVPPMSDYDYNKLTLFSDINIGDAKCIVPDIDDSASDEKINGLLNKYVVGLVRDDINHNLKKVKENNTVVDVKSHQKVLLPAYIMNTNNKDGICFINGQTGKVFMNYDISVKNIVIFSIVCFVLIFILVFLLAWII